MNLSLKLLTVTLLVCMVATSTHAAQNSSTFTASSKKIALGEELVLSWNVPSATGCLLYGPTSTERNVPDEFDVIESITVTPTQTHSDWQKGRSATYRLVCLDRSRLNNAGNYVEVYNKELMIQLKKEKRVARPSCTVTASGSFGEVTTKGKVKKVSIVDGESVSLTWDTKRAEYVDGPFGDRMETSGTGSVGPSVTDRYVFAAYNGNKKTMCTIQVRVR